MNSVAISEPKNISRISIATLKCSPAAVKKLPEADNTMLAIARLYGKVHDVKTVEDKSQGRFLTVFVGSFEGVNLQNGTTLRSSKLMLPAGIAEKVAKLVTALKEKDTKASIGFAFEIRAVKTDSDGGYRYDAATLKAPELEDELREIREAIAKIPVLAEERHKRSA